MMTVVMDVMVSLVVDVCGGMSVRVCERNGVFPEQRFVLISLHFDSIRKEHKAKAYTN